MTTSPTKLRLTPVGVTSLLAAVTTTLSGVGSLSGPVFTAGLSGLIILWVCRLSASRHLASIRVSRSLPHRALAGESFPVEALMAHDPGFPLGTTIHFSDPLASLKGDRTITLTNTDPSLLRYAGKSAQRGNFLSRNWTIRSSWPLGLFSGSRSGAFQDSNSLILLPKPFLPNRLKSHLNQLARESVNNSPEPPDPVSDFRLLREFRSGDPVRSINWPGSLKSGKLQVSEMEPPRPKPRTYGILIHSFEPQGQILTPETFEMILRIATGLVVRFQREEIPVIFRHYPDKTAALSNRTRFESTLDHLALCRRKPLTSLESLCKSTEIFRQCDEVFILSDCPRSEWEDKLCGLFGINTCIDATSLSSQSRPGLKTRLRLPS